MPIAAAIGTLFWPRKSDIASPMPVVRSFITQKIAVISGTLVKATRVRDELRSDIAACRPDHLAWVANVDHAITVRRPPHHDNALQDHLPRRAHPT